MGLFTTTAFAKGKTKSESNSTAWNNYKLRQEIIDSKYKDPISGDITSEKYFEESQNNIALAEKQGLTPAKMVSVIQEKNKLNRDLIKYRVTSAPQINTSLDEIRADIQDTWNNISLDKELIKTGSVKTMSELMEAQISEKRAEFEDFKSQVEEYTVDETILNNLDSIINVLSDEESFYRGASIEPERYRVDINMNQSGRLNNIDLKLKNESVKRGFADSGVEKDGFSVFGPEDSDLTNFDFANVIIQDKLNSPVGAILRSPNGINYVKKEDGSFMKANDQYLKDDLGIDKDRVIPISEKDTRNIERSFDVDEINETYFKNQETQKKHDEWMENFVSSEAGKYYTQPPVLTGAKDAFKALGTPLRMMREAEKGLPKFPKYSPEYTPEQIRKSEQSMAELKDASSKAFKTTGRFIKSTIDRARKGTEVISKGFQDIFTSGKDL
jgi:hypothetical protein